MADRGGVLERLIEAVAPARAVRRQEARVRLGLLRDIEARYDGAARGGRLSQRTVNNRAADSLTAMSLPRLRAVARDMERNNPYVQRAMTVIATNVVGAGIVPAVTGTSDREKQRVHRLITAHLETTACDFDRRHNLYGLQYLACRAMARDGEVLIVRYGATAAMGLPLPLQLRVMEADFIDSLKDGPLPNGNYCRQGIEFDQNGRRVAYHLFKHHPGGTDELAGLRMESQRTRAEDVIHLYRVDRPGQNRGVPWVTPAIVTMWDLKDYEEAELVRQRVAACFAAFVKSPTSSSVGAAVSARAGGYDVMKPGTIQHIDQTEDVVFATPPQVQGYSQFVSMNLRKFASAVGVPFNEIASDDSQENFSSSRRGYLVFQRLLDVWRWQTVIPQMCDVVGQWFLDTATQALGRVPTVTLSWTPPKRELISPKEEVAVMRDLVRGGFSSRSEQIRSLGYDPENIEAEIAAENTRADDLFLSFDSDGRKPINGPSVSEVGENGT